MSGSLRPVLPVISEGAAAIESAFMSAGQGLSRGLGAFKSLTDSLAALGAELDAGNTASASLSLGRMSRTLRATAGRLPADGATLAEMLGNNQGMTRQFDDLVGDMRMMVVVSRAARLEAVASDEQRVSLEAFSRTIDHEIGAVQRRIDVCASEHAKLTAVLERAARAHMAFDAQFRGRLVTLASELDEALETIQARRDAGLAFMGEAAAGARRITQAAGMALVSLQIGDNTRQRLEHVVFALERAEATATDGEDGAATVDLLCRLQEAQLRDTVATFEDEASSVLDAFGLLGREIASLVGAGRATYGQVAEGATPFMAEFTARFASAKDIVGACDATRRAVEHAIGELRAMLDALDQTLTTLGTTSEDLVIVAMNVGLKAARLGSQGRGLVTVAGELKRLASQISLHADRLLSTFQAVRRDSGHFGPLAGDGDAASTSLEGEAAAILEDLARGDARIAGVLASVDGTGRDFDARVGEAVRAFEAVVADTVRLTGAADHIARCGGGPDVDDAAREAAAATVNDFLLPLYSMAQERDVHGAVVGSPAVEPDHQDVEDWAA